ncbi:hypothetical protein BBJ29_002031 [Phytophthora kernoviae]|uniref:Amino acid transporter n=1 Tax=Phytophthora kernoviae TaxID=325452 RepID=A0A3F2RR70_9STRA|nr:hypothetical protein BBJ29_002031 [Phytophthora kernoviae]RLN62600.1 hypothetical protein BBP00_00004662 [Phytophthora kernoviae]
MPLDPFANAVGRRPPMPIVLLDEEQQQALRREQEQSEQQQRSGTGSSGSGLFVPTTPPMLPVPQHNAPQAPPPPTTSYLRTDFTTGNNEPIEDDSEDSLSLATDYANVEPTALPFVPSSEREREARPDPTKGFRGAKGNINLSVRYMLLGGVVGLALGILFAHLKVSDLAAQWISLPGDLFLRALKSLVVPYVFCSVAVAVGDIVFVGKVSIVGFQTLRIFAMGWVVSTLLGISLALLFRPLFRLHTDFSSPNTNAVRFTCANGLMLEMQSNDTLTCSSNATELTLDNAFVLEDVNEVFKKNSDSVIIDLTLTNQIITTLDSVVPSNIFAAMADADLLAIIAFAMVLGSVAGRNYFSKTRRVNYLYLVMLQLRNTFFLAMEWVIWATPVAVISIVSGAFATNQNAVSQLPKVYMYFVACVAAMLLQILVVYPCVIFVLARCNPYKHMRHMLRSYLFAFGSSSSLATAPVTLACVQKARVCSQSIATFVISIGVVTNMSGSGWYYPIGIIFLAESSGNGDEITFLRLVAIFFLTIVACAGTPPVPSSGMVLMSTMYKTVFGVSALPSTWALYVAMDFFADRLSTICNVNDDIMALKVIAESTDETVAGDHLGWRN